MLRTLLLMIALFFGQAFTTSYSEGAVLTDALLREMVARMGNDLVDPGRDYIDLPSHRIPMSLSDGISPHDLPNGLDYDEMALSPSLRDREYLAHSSLLGTLLGSYGDASEASIQRLKPTASAGKITSELKTDGVLPAYCNPPNPCPVGYTAEDGCLEDFENTAGFSREYQSMQECMCDTEHMFQCPDSTRDSEITALARSIQNEGVLDLTLDKILAQLNVPSHRLVAKKFHEKKNVNPYLAGERLPIAAKKGW